ncbi:MAG: hypothetical protein IEMM0006_1416 [bacterium]|nr:MAG: hypothetical protein IEMM0006_1416 [bacterium]
MNHLPQINPYNFHLRINELWKNQWLLLTVGDLEKGDFNTMTVAWGSMGIMWRKPFVMVVVRPTRYTFGFMNRYPDFTLSTFPKEYHKDLSLLGKKSGRDGDKIAETRLHPIASETIESPAFAEAELILECKKIYWEDLNPGHFLDPSIEKNYKNHDEHRMYFGEILRIKGTEKYIVKKS